MRKRSNVHPANAGTARPRAVRPDTLRTGALLALLGLGLSACDGATDTPQSGALVADLGGGAAGGQGGAGGGTPPVTPPTVAEPPVPEDPPRTPATEPGHGQPPPEDRPVVVGEGEQANLLPPEAPPPPVVPAEAPARPRRRMNLDQLDASIRQATGGVGWTEVRGNVEVNLFVELASTLGKPDFVQVTHEDLEPSALFQKFLDDAARSVCAATLAADAQRPAAERALLRFVEADTVPAEARAAVTANLQYLLRRFHGRNLRLDDPNLEAWRWQLEATVFSQVAPAAAWGAVCVALITHPHFYTY